MSSAVAHPRPRALARRGRTGTPVGATGAWRLQGLSILAFSILGLLAGQRFVSLLSNPSLPRVAGICTVAAALGAGLLMTGTPPGRDRPVGALRLGLALLALYLAMRIAGIPGGQLLPWHWGSLAGALDRGTGQLDGLWPYRGNSTQARIDIQACVAAALIPAAALIFWPGRGHAAARRLLALGLVLSLYVAGAANEPKTGWQVQGLIALSALYLWAWSSRARRAEDGRAAAWLIAGTIASLLLAGTLAGAMPLINIRAWQPFGEPGATTAFQWNQTYVPLPWSTSTATMAEASSPSPHLWRATVLDRFDGTRFLASGYPPAEPVGLAIEHGNQRWITTTTFTVRALAGRDLLSPGQILAARTAASFPASLGPATPDGTLTAPNNLAGGARYTITAYAPKPSVSEMREGGREPLAGGFGPYVRFGVPSTEGPPVQVSTATAAGRARVEASPYAGVYALARRLGGGASNTYDLATRIEAFLRRGFTYDTHPPRSALPLASFLLGQRRGYCQQFSGAMALMLRMDNVPARIASGFQPGSRSSPSAPFAFRGTEAHDWVEVFFGGIGWVPFDPTPGPTVKRALGNGGSEVSPAQRAAAGSATGTHPAGGPTRTSSGRSAGARPGAGPLIAACLAAVVLLLGAVLLVAGPPARRRKRGGHSDAAVEELRRALSRLGRAPAAGTTLAELEASLTDAYGSPAGGYPRALRRMRYSPAAGAPPPSPAERRALRRALTSGRGPIVKIRGLLALPPRIG